MWLMSVLFALAFVGLLAAVFFGVRYFKKDKEPGSEAVSFQNPTTAGGAQASPLLKHIEIVGLRLVQDAKKRAEVRFVVVNHSAAELPDMTAKVRLRAVTSKKDEEPVGTFSFKLPSLGPYESKELTSILDTKLRVYEMPDWQNLREEIQLSTR
jgi:hypothetical protein